MTRGRLLALTLVAGALPSGFAQVIWSPTDGQVNAIRQARGNGFNVPGHPSPEGKELAPGPEQTSPDFRLIHADNSHFRGGGNLVELTGSCLFEVKGYRVFCDKAVGDLRTQVFTLSGHVLLNGNDLDVKGKQIIIEFATGRYRAYDAEGSVGPQVVQGTLKDKIYIKGAESFGTPKETTTRKGDFTTCDKDEPHFDIESDDTIIRPKVRAIMRRVRIRILGRTVARLPFLSFPLDDRTYNNLPQMGQSADEGYYIKNRFGIPLNNLTSLDTREDYMSKLGTGLGTDYKYSGTKAAGLFSIYKITGNADTLILSNLHQQRLSFGLLQFQNDYKKNDYLSSPNSTSFSTRATLQIPQGKNSDAFTFSRSSSEGDGYSSSTQTLSLADQRSFGTGNRNTLNLNWLTATSSYSGGTSSSNERLDVQLRTDQDFNRATASLEYQRAIPIGDANSYTGSSDRTPVVTVSSDAQKLFGDSYKAFPFKTSLSVGEFTQSTLQTHVTRSNFDFNFSHPDASKNRFKIDYTGDFKQSLYSDDTAQYILNFGTNWRYDFGGNTGINLRYNYLRPYGYTPLSIDQSGKTNYVSGDLNYRPIESLLIGAQTGYDINRLDSKDIPWQQLGLRTEYKPQKWFQLRGLYTYDTYNQIWSSLRFDLTYIPGATFFTLSSRYDGANKQWAGVDATLTNLKSGRVLFSSTISYNGYLQQFQSKQYSFVYDLHDIEAILSVNESDYGFRPGRTVGFYLRLKALPFNLPFATSNRGTAVGTGTGGGF